jgi:hypothetical protein
VENSDHLEGWFKNNANKLEEGTIFGGKSAVSVEAQAELEEAAQSVTSNQDYTVTPAGAQNVESNDVQQFSVAGITSETANVQLFACDNVTSDQNGVTSFEGSNEGGAGNTALVGDNGTAVISVVNGQDVADADEQQNVNSADGTVDFTVQGGSVDDCYVAVIFDDADDDNRLDLAPNGEPTEDFATTGEVTVVPDEAAAGNITGVDVDSANKAADYFVQDGQTFYYDGDDRYQLVGVNGTLTTITQEEFENRVSAGDQVRGDYAPGGSSRFALEDQAPALVQNVVATDVAQGVQVTWDNSTTATTASYRVLRANAVPPTITGGAFTCPTADSAYTQVGTEADERANPNDDTDAINTFVDTTTVKGQSYCYRVVAVDESGDESGQSGSSNVVAEDDEAVAPDTTAPEFTAAAAEGNTVVVTYDELIQCDTVDALASNYAVTTVDAQGNETGRVETAAVCESPESGTVGSATEQLDTQVEITVTGSPFTDGEIVRVRALNGTDGNTVLDAQGQAQPTSDAVQTAATVAGP